MPDPDNVRPVEEGESICNDQLAKSTGGGAGEFQAKDKRPLTLFRSPILKSILGALWVSSSEAVKENHGWSDRSRLLKNVESYPLFAGLAQLRSQTVSKSPKSSPV
jgi:hypothetical protein